MTRDRGGGFQSREKWLETRRRFIGSSDAGACMLDDEGYPLSPWGSPYTVWLDKLGLLPDEDNDMMAAGRHLEAGIRQWYTEESGVYFVRTPAGTAGFFFAGGRGQPGIWANRFATIYHRDFQAWSPDGAVVDAESGLMHPLEIKLADAYKLDEWIDTDHGFWPPPVYYAQIQHAMAVSGSDRATIVCLFVGRGTRDLRWVDVPRDEDFIERMTAAERVVWDCVQSGEPPPIDPSPQTARALGIHAPQRATRVGPLVEPVQLPTEALAWDDEYVLASAAMKALKRQRDGAATRIRGAIGDGELGILPNGIRYSIDKSGRLRRRGHPEVMAPAEAQVAARRAELESAVRRTLVTAYASCGMVIQPMGPESAHLGVSLRETAARFHNGSETPEEAAMLESLVSGGER